MGWERTTGRGCGPTARSSPTWPGTLRRSPTRSPSPSKLAPNGRLVTSNWNGDTGSACHCYYFPDSGGGLGADNRQGVWTYSAQFTDLAGNASPLSNTLAITFDSIAPVILPPSNVVAEATGPSGAVVSYPPATVTDASPTTVTYSRASGTTFAIGTTTVTVGAVDLAGNVAAPATFTVQVRDTTPPTVTISAPINGATYDIGVSIVFSYTATDLVGVTSQSATLDGAPITNGATINTFNLAAGLHTVTVTARDAAGNTTTKSSTFRVRATPAGLKSAVLAGVASGKIAAQLQSALIAQLTMVQVDLAAGNIAQAKVDLQQFINLVNAQSGKKIDPAYAAKLVQWAQDLLNSL